MGLGRALSESLWTVGTTIWKREAAWQGPVSTVTQKEREKETHYPPFSAGDVQVRTAASQVQLWPLEDIKPIFCLATPITPMGVLWQRNCQTFVNLIF